MNFHKYRKSSPFRKKDPMKNVCIDSHAINYEDWNKGTKQILYCDIIIQDIYYFLKVLLPLSARFPTF